MNEQNGKRRSPPGAAASNVMHLSHRLITLLELQVELLKVDVRDGLRAAIRPIVLMAAGIVVGLSSIPVLLMTVAHGLREWAGLSWPISFLIATVLGAIIAAAALWGGWKLLQRGLTVFDRSKQELQTNVAWLKNALKHDSAERSECESIR